MKVLILSQYFFPEVGATQTRMYEFARALVAQGHQVDVLTEFPNHPGGVMPPDYRGRWFERDESHPFRIFRVWVATSARKTFGTRLAFYGSFLATALLGSLRLPRRYDVVVATSPPLPVALAGSIIARRTRAALVMDVRDLWPKAAQALGELSNPWLYRMAEKLELRLYQKADTITATTRSFCRYIRDLGIDPMKIIHVSNGTLREIFAPERGSADLRTRLGLDGKFVVTYAGIHGLAQNLEIALAAAERLQGKDDVQFLFVGEGPRKAQLVREAETRRLKNVRFLPQVPLEESAYYLNASDAILVPLARHPVFTMFVPSKLYDGMACGKPILLAVDGEAREILEQAGAGLFVEPGDPQVLVAAIRHLLHHPEFCKEAGERGRLFVTRRYLRGEQAARFVEVVAAAHRRHRRQSSHRGQEFPAEPTADHSVLPRLGPNGPEC